MEIRNDAVASGRKDIPRQQGLESQPDDVGNLELTPEIGAELLNPESWRNTLKLFADTTGLAVALVAPDGRLVGTCHNAQPIWSLAREARPVWGTGCLFCLQTDGRCAAASDARTTNSVVLVHDTAGFAHVALPLTLGGRHLATLIAGQVFDRYPEPLPLERVAREFGLSPQRLWHLARHAAPISRSNLFIRGNLLFTLGQAFLRKLYAGILEKRLAETNKRLQSFNDELETVNSELSRKVAELDSVNSDLKNLFDSTEIATLFLNRDLRVKSFTPAAGNLFHLGPRDIGRPVGDLTAQFGESLGADFVEDIASCLKTLSVREREWTRDRGRHYLMRILPYRTVHQVVDGLVLTFADVTQLKQSEELAEERVRDRTAQLQAANTELEAFAYSVAHDLRTPLRGIDGWSTALEEDYGSQLDHRGHEYLARVRSEAQRLGHLIDDLLQLSRITRGQLELHPVDLAALATVVAVRLRETYSGRSLQFVIEPDLTVMGDARLLEIVLTNLFDNAAKFTATREEGRIEFGRTLIKDENVFYVHDNGVGFDMAHVNRLFVAFQRLHKPSEFPGSGIGLVTVLRVIQRHGGRIWADASADRGATFYFTLGDAP